MDVPMVSSVSAICWAQIKQESCTNGSNPRFAQNWNNRFALRWYTGLLFSGCMLRPAAARRERLLPISTSSSELRSMGKSSTSFRFESAQTNSRKNKNHKTQRNQKQRSCSGDLATDFEAQTEHFQKLSLLKLATCEITRTQALSQIRHNKEDEWIFKLKFVINTRSMTFRSKFSKCSITTNTGTGTRSWCPIQHFHHWIMY